MGFSNILKAELYKLAKGKSLIKILIAVAIVFTISSIVFALLYNVLGDALNMVSSSESVTQEDIDALEAQIAQYEQVQNEMKANIRFHDTTLYELKATLVLYKYMLNNNLSFSNINVFGQSFALSTNSYMSFMMQIMSLMIIVYASISMIKSALGEKINGTLKMQLLRPIQKEQMIIAKALAVCIVSFGIFIFTTVLSGIVGIAAFKVDARDVLVVLNGTSIGVISPMGDLLIKFIYYTGRLIAYIVFSMFLSTMVKKSEGLAIAISMIMIFIGNTIEDIFGYLFVGYVGFNINLNWTSALTTSGPSLSNMNLYTMLAVSFVWVCGMFVSSIFTFKHQEVHN